MGPNGNGNPLTDLQNILVCIYNNNYHYSSAKKLLYVFIRIYKIVCIFVVIEGACSDRTNGHSS